MNLDDPEIITAAPDGRSPKEQPVWRQEYPIDWPQSEYISRREFTRLLLVTSLAFVVGQAYIVVSSWLRQRQAQPAAAEIAAVADVPVKATKLFYYPSANDPCVVVRISENEFVAYSQKCTHLSCPVIPDAAAGRIRCPCHEGLYDLRTGDVISGPPERPLPRITLQIRDGRIFATGLAGGAL
jgi:nitrite reductase/ring-hydroxylating ferredoxin subunit